jgi:FKBP-type peptidyl-prolyl cis-trans isomerase SlyD
MKVEKGTYVEYAYKLYNDADNTLLFEATAKEPDMMVCGVSQEVVPGLMTAMEGLQAGDRFGVTLPPEAAFGEWIQDNVITLDKDIFMRDGELAEEVKVDALLPMMTAEGFRVMGKVLEIADQVKMDFNHPFAGLTVRYDGEIVNVRKATPEEMQPKGGCGGGCCGGKDKSCGNGCGGCC